MSTTIKFKQDAAFRYVIDYLHECDATIAKRVSLSNLNYLECYNCGTLCDVIDGSCYECGKDFVGMIVEGESYNV
jgi:hypothetical protein